MHEPLQARCVTQTVISVKVQVNSLGHQICAQLNFPSELVQVKTKCQLVKTLIMVAPTESFLAK